MFPACLSQPSNVDAFNIYLIVFKYYSLQQKEVMPEFLLLRIMWPPHLLLIRPCLCNCIFNVNIMGTEFFKK